MTAVQREAGAFECCTSMRQEHGRPEKSAAGEGPHRRYRVAWLMSSVLDPREQEQPPVSSVLGKERLERREQAMAVPKLVKVGESCVV